MAGSFVALPITAPHLWSEASVGLGDGLARGRDQALCRGAMQHSGGTDKGSKGVHMLSPVPLHSNILLQTLSLRFGPEAPAEE